ncbi:hypothetical protein AN191_13690 [Loktanella sp. 5RATIMAR09]|uniref:hypothetical protein n=1 Tax=Loktanella sp. 5RATIMAR09 TaxID=1225655 RepID=UPI0006EBCF59|nr:hypothetical protein [Loktanella sp. 5RATIMAR09]KQI71327.1 hypothetical protein AN191_13690 [Loktanella sp. 5RATIMAR09]
MKLTNDTNGALRSLQLAVLKTPDRVHVDDVAKNHGLSRPPEEPVVGDVVESVNPEKNTRPLMGIWVLSRKMQEATATVMAIFDDLTIADILANRNQLMERIAPLETPAPAAAAR